MRVESKGAVTKSSFCFSRPSIVGTELDCVEYSVEVVEVVKGRVVAGASGFEKHSTNRRLFLFPEYR